MVVQYTVSGIVVMSELYPARHISFCNTGCHSVPLKACLPAFFLGKLHRTIVQRAEAKPHFDVRSALEFTQKELPHLRHSLLGEMR